MDGPMEWGGEDYNHDVEEAGPLNYSTAYDDKAYDYGDVVPNGTQIPDYGEYGDYDYDYMFGNESCSGSFNFSGFAYHYSRDLWVPITHVEVYKIIAYVLLTVVSLIGNSLVILVVYYNRPMRSSTNQYLVNLAVADLLVTLTYPLHLVRNLSAEMQFHLPEFFCKLDGFINTCVLLASVLTLAVISFGRFVAVLFPLRAHTSPDRARIVIAGIWVISMIIASPLLKVRRLHIVEWSDFTSIHCNEDWPTTYVFNEDAGLCEAIKDGQYPYYLTVMVGFYFVPISSMIASYSCVIWRLWGTTLPGEHSQSGRNTQDRAKRKVLKMITIVFLMFVICMTPMQGVLLYTMCIHDVNKRGDLPQWFSGLEFAAYFLASTNSAINPIIYCGCNANFRKGLKSLFHSRKSAASASSTRNSNFRWNYFRTLSFTRRTNVDHTAYSGPEPVVLLECNSFSKHRDVSMISTVSMSSVGDPQPLDEATVRIASWPPWQTNHNGQANNLNGQTNHSRPTNHNIQTNHNTGS